MSKNIEEHRAKWAEIAKENGWYQEPFYVQVWMNKEGEITDSVSTRGLESDIIEKEEECAVCEESIEDEVFTDQSGDSFCESCWYDEEDGVYFCQNCDDRLILNRDEIAWQDKVNYTDPLCVECGTAEGVNA